MAEKTEERQASQVDLLPRAPSGWLESMLSLVSEAAMMLGKAESGDEVLRMAIVVAKDRLGFSRLATWFFEDGGAAAVGTFGVDECGQISDERGHRIFDRTGVLSCMRDFWNKPPHYYLRVGVDLRNSHGEVLGKGVHVTVPLIHEGEILGFMAADDLRETPVMNDCVGFVLMQYAHVVSSIYFHKLAAERVEEAQRALEQAERLKSEFLGMMGHEIRTPLNAIMGYSQLLGMNPSVDNVKSLSRTIEGCSEHLSELINGILEYSQLSGASLKRLYRPNDLVEVCAATVDSFQDAYRRKGVELVFSHVGTEGQEVLSDAVAFRQIVSNLLQNALKFTLGGNVVVRLQTRLKSQGSSEFFLTVEDNGIGMDPKRLGEIFKPFRQLDSSLTRKAGGIGMGLAIVERLVAALGGRIECESALGVGTKFSVDFLFTNVEEKEAGRSNSTEDRAAEVKQRREVRILVVEDHKQSCEVLLKMVEALGFVRPDSAENGALGKKALQERPYDLLLLDVEMPEMDGLELTRQIRSGSCGPINREIGIVGITAFASEVNREICLIAGMDDYIVKPVKIPLLKRALESRLTS